MRLGGRPGRRDVLTTDLSLEALLCIRKTQKPGLDLCRSCWPYHRAQQVGNLRSYGTIALAAQEQAEDRDETEQDEHASELLSMRLARVAQSSTWGGFLSAACVGRWAGWGGLRRVLITRQGNIQRRPFEPTSPLQELVCVSLMIHRVPWLSDGTVRVAERYEARHHRRTTGRDSVRCLRDGDAWQGCPVQGNVFPLGTYAIG